MNDRYTEEKNKFQQILNNLKSQNKEFFKPYILIFRATDDEDKENLLQKLKEITTKESFDNQFNILDINWNEIHDSDIEKSLENVYECLIKNNQEYENKFYDYKKIKDEWKNAKEEIRRALRELEDTKFIDLKALNVDDILELMRMNDPNSQEEDFLNVNDFIKYLNEKEYTELDSDFFRKPQNYLAKQLGSGIQNIAEEKPLIIFLNNYEVNYEEKDEIDFDYILRDAIKNSAGNLVWVITGKTNLLDSGWKNPDANKALLSIFDNEDEDPDVIAIAIRLLEKFDNKVAVEKLVSFLDNPDRFVVEAALYKLGNLAQFGPCQEIILEKAIEKIIIIHRNHYMSSVREKAEKALETINKETESLDNYQEERKKVKRVVSQKKENNELPENLKKLIDDFDSTENIRSREDYAQQIIDFLSDKDPDIRAKVANLLCDKEIGMGKKIESLENKKIIEALHKALIKALKFDVDGDGNGESDRFVRQEAATALGQLKPTEDIVEALNDAARLDVISDVREKAKESLTSISNNESVPNIKKKAERYVNLLRIPELELSEQEKPELIQQNSSGELDVDVDEIFNILKDNSDIDRLIKAIQTLKSKFKNTQDIKIKDKIIDALIQAINDTDENVCAAAAVTLGEIQDSRALNPLLNKIKDDNPSEYYKDLIAREAAVKAIGQLNSTTEELYKEGTVDILINIWRNDPIRDVRQAVEKALEKIYIRTKDSGVHKALLRYSENNEEHYKKLLEDNS